LGENGVLSEERSEVGVMGERWMDGRMDGGEALWDDWWVDDGHRLFFSQKVSVRMWSAFCSAQSRGRKEPQQGKTGKNHGKAKQKKEGMMGKQPLVPRRKSLRVRVVWLLGCLTFVHPAGCTWASLSAVAS
jgi:hypothetical protein